MQLALEDEMLKLRQADQELVRAEKVESEAYAKEVHHKNLQGKATSIAQAAQDGTVEVDVSAILPAHDDPDLSEAGRL